MVKVMTKLDKALLDFVRNTDGKTPTVIYAGIDILNELRMHNSSYYQLDFKNGLYCGILLYMVSGEPEHLAVY